MSYYSGRERKCSLIYVVFSVESESECLENKVILSKCLVYEYVGMISRWMQHTRAGGGRHARPKDDQWRRFEKSMSSRLGQSKRLEEFQVFFFFHGE